jgi:hypothetical protein
VKSYSLAQIGRWREKTHRRLPRLRITSSTQTIRFVNEIGYCFMFQTGESDLPSIAGALRPKSKGSMDAGEREQAGHWQLRGVLPDERQVFRGKLLLRRPMLLSLEYLPFFIALNKRRVPARAPGPVPHPLSSTSRLILDALQRKSMQSTNDLRRRVTVSSGIGAGAFEVAMTQLQIQLLIGSVADDRTPLSRLWIPLQRLYPSQFRKAKRISVEEARRAILERHFRNQLVLTVADIKHLFRWERQEIFQTLGELIRRGVVTPEVQVDGIADRTYCLLT